MTSTGPLEVTEEIRLVRDSARGFLESHWPAARAVAMAEDAEALRRIWRDAAKQGWSALDLDGAELGLAAAVVLLQELGRAACPIPVLDAVLAQSALADAGKSGAAGMLLDALRRGEAAVTWTFGPASGEAQAFDVSVTETSPRRLKGRVAFVENTAMATHLLIVTGRPDEIAIVPIDAPGVSVRLTKGLSAPALAEVELDGVERFDTVTTRFDLATLPSLARLLLAARALGAAARGLEMLADYAKVRVQFGKKIGQYQAIQHKLANCLMSIEVTRLAVMRAGAPTASAAERIYAAAIAAACAGQTLRQVCLELHHGFGGVSFWEEHEMPRHFRRIHGDLARLGGVHAARRDIARALLDPVAQASLKPKIPDLSLGEQADAFRRELRAWLAENLSQEPEPVDESIPVNHRKAKRSFSQKLGKKGWIGLTWPKQWGGQERSTLEHLVFEEEMAYAEAPVTWHNTSANMIAPTLIAHGSPEQCARLLPGIAKGDISFALGYSEPDYGSDLAGIRTAATRVGDEWVIRGQKIYTSTAGFSNYVWLAARTDPAERRHHGISVFVVPLDTPGISMQPMLGLNGHRANVVFYDDVHVPADALVGQVNDGWKVITAALAYERVTLAAIAARARSYFDRLLTYLLQAEREGKPMAQDSLVRDRIAGFAAEIEVARLLAVQTAQVMARGAVPVCEAAMLKVYSSELMERLAEAAIDILGTGATLRPGSDSTLIDGSFEYGVRDALLYTIGGGTNEIQRSLIALRGLDLPR